MTLVPQLERDLRIAAQRRRWGPRVLPRGRRAAALGVVAAAIATGGAGAATGLVKIGRQEPTPKERQADGLLYAAPRTLVAAGRAPTAGRWEMTVTTSDVGPCLGLRLLDEPPGGGGLGEGCGNDATFTVGSTSNGFPVDRPELANRWKLVYGRAPEEAVRVELSAANGLRQSVATHDGPPEIYGDFYLLEAPGKIKDATVRAFDADGRPLGPGLDVS